MNKLFTHLMTLFMIGVAISDVTGMESQKRDRGISFYRCLNSNTSGPENLWVQLGAIGHIWDDTPIKMDSLSKGSGGLWISNIRAFPEIKAHIGLLDFAMISLESRLLGNFWSPGWFSGACKLTLPNNKELRLHGYALDLRYSYQCIESNPTLGGYIGFMPEGFVSKGHNIETRFIYELDFLPKLSTLPLRLLVNAGTRFPLRHDRADFYQYLIDAAAIYSGNGFDFFVAYSLEAFNNITGPAILRTDEHKRIALFFSENPMYAIFGGSIRYNNGLSFSVTVPILLSTNTESKMTPEDLKNLNQLRQDLYPREVRLGIRDPFDPWFVKWKIVGSIEFPLRFKMTSAEMMRNFLILKNRPQDKKIDIDDQLQLFDIDMDKKETENDRKRLEAIRKRKEQVQE